MKKRVLIILAAAICVAAALAVFLPGRGIDFATNRALREQLAAQNASDALSLHQHVYRAAKAAGEEGTRCPYGGTVQYQTTINGQTVQVGITPIWTSTTPSTTFWSSWRPIPTAAAPPPETAPIPTTWRPLWTVQRPPSPAVWRHLSKRPADTRRSSVFCVTDG